MKILALQSSYRKNGNTTRIVRLVEDRLGQLSARDGFPLEFEYVALPEADIGLCRGCRVCFDQGEDKCPLKDGLPGLYEKLQNAAGVIVATPVYVEDVTAVMKNFIDRMAFCCHRPSFAGKTAVVITTSGSGSTNHALRTVKYAFGSWGFHLAGLKKFRMGALMTQEEAEMKFGAAADKLAAELSSAVLSQKALKPSFMSLMIFKVQQTIYRTSPVFKDTYDRDWWNTTGRLDKKRTFYIPHRANPIKVKAARAAGAVLAKVFR